MLPPVKPDRGTRQAVVGDVWTVVDGAIEALKCVDEIVWDFPEHG